MKKNIISFILCLGFVLSTTAVLAHEGEALPDGVTAPFGLSRGSMLPDGTFDDGTAWTVNFSGASGTVSVAEKSDPSGGNSMEVYITGDGEKVNAIQIRKDSVSGNIVQGRTYIMGFWAKLNGASSYELGQLWLRDTGENKTVSDRRQKVTLPGDNKWHYYSFAFKATYSAPAAAAMIQFGNQGRSKFTISFDEITLRELLTEEPMTLPELKATNTVKFTDISGHWAEKEIKDMAAKGIINGRDENTFDPEAPITRAEFTSMLVRAIGFKAAKGTNPFTDVKARDWFAPEVDIASSAGIIDSNFAWQGNFLPDAHLKREEMAMFTSLTYEVMSGATVSDMSIVYVKDRTEISDWAITYVKKALKSKVMKGTDYYYFEPQGVCTRAQAATVINRLRAMLEPIM